MPTQIAVLAQQQLQSTLPQSWSPTRHLELTSPYSHRRASNNNTQQLNQQLQTVAIANSSTQKHRTAGKKHRGTDVFNGIYDEKELKEFKEPTMMMEEDAEEDRQSQPLSLSSELRSNSHRSHSSPSSSLVHRIHSSSNNSPVDPETFVIREHRASNGIPSSDTKHIYVQNQNNPTGEESDITIIPTIHKDHHHRHRHHHSNRQRERSQPQTPVSSVHRFTSKRYSYSPSNDLLSLSISTPLSPPPPLMGANRKSSSSLSRHLHHVTARYT